WITGADAKNRHVVGLVAGRDFQIDEFVEASEVHEGDPAPEGQGTLTLKRGIELGHIFQLGRKYTQAFDVQILDENRSEEHTSELQSRFDLVCRLLLEKKNNKGYRYINMDNRAGPLS